MTFALGRQLFAGLALLIIVAASGCASRPPVARLTTFDESFYKGYDGVGDCILTGQAFAKTAGGDVKYAAGNTISLNPVTPYSTEFWDKWVLHGKQLEPADERATKYYREVVADGEGRFKFAGLPPGRYYVTGYISWEIGNKTSEAVLGGEATLAAGESKDLILQPKIVRNYPGFWLNYETGKRANKP